MATTFVSDPITNDLALTTDAVTGKKYLTLEKDFVIAAASKLFRRFQFFQGEWFLDKRLGVPYLKFLLVKNPDFSIIRQVLRQIILSIDVVSQVLSLNFEYNTSTRSLDFSFEALASDGRKVSGGLSKPFIVDGRPIGSGQIGGTSL